MEAEHATARSLAAAATLDRQVSTSSRNSNTRFVKGLVPTHTSVQKPSNVDGPGLLGIIWHPLNVLLVMCPIGTVSYFLQWGEVVTFWSNFLALVPLAKILGDATEELAAGLKDDMLAGLLNATFGNAVEMVIMVSTLRAGLIEVVKATLLGSVLSNLLLVLGTSFFCGGLMGQVKQRKAKRTGTASSEIQIPRRLAATPVTLPRNAGSGERPLMTESTSTTLVTPVPEASDGSGSEAQFAKEKIQTFPLLIALVNTSLLLLSCLSFSLVTVFYNSHLADERKVMAQEVLLPVSRICSVVIIFAYCAYIFFQLVTHRHSMGGEDDVEEEEEPMLSVRTSTLLMLLTTCVVAFASELLVHSLEGAAEEANLSQHFIGIVLLPIVGNACEHASAVRFAIMDKPGLSVGIAIGSSTQIALFVVPFAVLTGWLIHQPMDLNFGSLNVTVMSISVVVVLSVVVDGQTNWLQGFLLMSAYAVIAVLYWYMPDADHL